LNDARNNTGTYGRMNLSPLNNILIMISAGSKGNNTNIGQILACVGGQNVEGKRITYGFNKRTLPHFTIFFFFFLHFY
jgi:DNA-directed RNA polymerase II subunit RPB1